ncbi:MAG: UDP binding domain-containing protein, partial [Bacteroidota bacterium]
RSKEENAKGISVTEDPYEACKDAHAVAVLTEWDEFKEYDWQRIYDNMKKPAFVFDGRNLLDGEKLKQIGFVFQAIGK